MRLIANENVAASVVDEFRRRGHDVLAVKESMRGATDSVILARTQAEARIVLTCDKDFGELAFGYRLPATSGVILLRLTGTDPEVDRRRAVEAIESRSDWPGHFAVITDDRIRIRSLPKL